MQSAKAAKAIAGRALGYAGREVRRAPGARADVHELAGVTFPDLLELFVQARGPERVSFVQVGAHDGLSNDWLHDVTVRYGLSGLLVEPQPAVFRALQRNYAGAEHLVFENVAISDHDGSQNLYVIKGDIEFLEYANQVASFDREHIRSQLSKHLRGVAPRSVVDEMTRRGLSVDDCIDVEVVETSTFASLLARHGVQRFDMLQIDAEGFDFEIIKTANLERYTPGLVNYEHEHLSRSDQIQCWNYLGSLGYRVFTHEGDTGAYLPANATITLS